MSNAGNPFPHSFGDGLLIERELGGGGMSRVFVARDRALGRPIVIKVLSPDLFSESGVERFRREIEVAARLQHPHIVPLLAAGTTDGVPYYTMPYVDGESLRKRIVNNGALPIAEVVAVLRDLADALVYAHARGVIHRDIKPENVLISGQHAMVTDFGVAKALSASQASSPGGHTATPLTAAGVSLGTVGYMAPEQAVADPSADHRVDLYALGVVAYEMLTAATPFVGNSMSSVLSAQMTGRAPAVRAARADTPGRLGVLVAGCLERDPARRPARADDVLRELEDIAAALRPPRRMRRRVAATIAVFFPLAAGVAVAAVPRSARATAFTLLRRAAATRHANRVIVAPFRNETGNARLDPLSDLTADVLAQGLSRLSHLEVVDGRTALVTNRIVEALPWFMRLRGRDRAVADESGASVIVSGRFYQVGDTLHFLASLTDLGTQRVMQVLTDVTGRAASPQAVLVTLRNRVVATLAVASDTAAVGSMGEISDPPTIEAYQETLKGLEGFMRRDASFTQPLRRAEALDSSYVTPVVLQAMAIYRDQFAVAAAAIQRANRLRDRMTSAERAILDHARARLQGAPDGGLAYAQEAMRLLPASVEVPLLVAGTALQLGDADIASSALDRTDADRGLNLVSSYYWRHRTEVAHKRGQHARAASLAAEGLRRFPVDSDLVRARAWELVDLGQRDEAQRLVEHGAPTGSWLAAPVAEAMVMRGHADDARAMARTWLARPLDGPTRTARANRLRLFAVAQAWDSVRALAASLAAADTGRDRRWDVQAGAVASAHLGDRRTALAADSALERATDPYDFGRATWWRAHIYAALAERERAIGLLRRALEEGLRVQYTEWPLERDAWLAPLIGTAEFLALPSKLK